MKVLLVLGGLAALLALACWREARRGRPTWGAHLRDEPPGTVDAARGAKRGAAAAALGGLGAGLDGGDG